jgi:hypothetical protein
MTKSVKLVATIVLAMGIVAVGTHGSSTAAPTFAVEAGAQASTATSTATAKSGQSAAPTVTATPKGGRPATPTATATPKGGQSATPTATATAKGGRPAIPTVTATRIMLKPIVHNPTPIPAVHKHLTLPAPVVVEVATKILATGLSTTAALRLANKYAPQVFIQAPTYVPAGYVLHFIHVDPQLDPQGPVDVYLEYVPKGLKNAGGTYPSVVITKELNGAPVLLPGANPTTVTINKGIAGIGIVTGSLVDLKPKNGLEAIHIIWIRASVSYDVSSVVGISKLTQQQLLQIAATVQ